jgi:hypothetical protein
MKPADLHRRAALVAAVAALMVAGSALAAGPPPGPTPAPDPARSPRATAPAKIPRAAPLAPPAALALPQGGDTIADAVPLALPVVGLTGSTAGYTDDYDEVCPYDGSTSPDVVYSLTPTIGMTVTIDMCGSSYDTKIYVYDAALQLVACNDDYYPWGDPCGSYVSRLLDIPLAAGTTSYLVIDGYGGESGDYVLSVDAPVEPPPCELEYIDGAQDEGEPPLTDGYVDEFNGGCNTPGLEPFSTIVGSLFMGRSGWYLGADGASTRDTDWFELVIPEFYGYFEVTGDAEQPCFILELGPTDCGSAEVLQTLEIGPCSDATMIIDGPPGATVWLWVGPQSFSPPDGFVGYEFYYQLILGLPITTEVQTFSTIRSLFR